MQITKYIRVSLSKMVTVCCLVFLDNISCKKFVAIDPPPTQLTADNVFISDASATSAILGIYSKMMGGSSGLVSGTQSIALLSGLSADEFRNYSTSSDKLEFYTNSLSTGNPVLLSLWGELYTYINNANAAIEGMNSQQGMSTTLKQQLLGECLFIRSFCNFYLVNSFGDIPMILNTDYQAAAVASRTSKATVYKQIVSDLKTAQSYLTDQYVAADNTATTDRVRPNKWVATALLSRVYLYIRDYANAAAQASDLIANPDYSLETDINSVFLKNSSESIWQLMPVFPGYNTFDGLIFILTTPPNYVTISDQLLAAFEPGDYRRINWIHDTIINAQSYSYPYKYKVKAGSSLSEYLTVFRLAEQYLIRAEARVKNNDLTGARDDLNMIRSRAGLGSTSATTAEDLLLAIEHERQTELFSEWGHRWFDLKRTGRADDVIGLVKASNWQPTDTLYPLNQTILDRDPNIVQNPGY